jgi:tetratricopeptide (TPR) repeat protein
MTQDQECKPCEQRIKGDKLFDEGKYEEAIQKYKAALNKNFCNGKAFYGMGRAQYQLKQYNEALHSFEKALIVRECKYEPYLLAKANTLYKLGRYQAAVNYYDKAVSLREYDSKKYAFNKGCALMQSKKFDEAIEEFDFELSKDKEKKSYVHNNKGYALFQLKKYNEAINEFNNAIKLNGNNCTYFTNKGLCLYHLGKFDLALKAFDKAIEKDKNNVEAINNKGCALFALGDKKNAKIEFNKAFNLSSIDKYKQNIATCEEAKSTKENENASKSDDKVICNNAIPPTSQEKGNGPVINFNIIYEKS